MSFGLFSVIFRKEMIDHLRDRRSLFSASIGVLFGPLVLGFMLGEMAGERRELEEVRLPFVGREYAPGLASWLEAQRGVTLLDEVESPEEAVVAGRRELVVVASAEFAEDMAAGRTGSLEIFYSDERDRSRGKVQRVRRLLEAYGGRMGDLRLIARGVNPVVAKPLEVKEREVSQRNNRSRRLLGLAPMMILLAAFAAGMSAAADSTAGERERGSLEALLANPVTANEVVLGKWAAAAGLAVAGVLLGLAVNLAMLYHSPLYELGIRFRLEPMMVSALAALCVPVALFASALEMLIASFAKSFKEAQSYLAFVTLLPTVPLMLTAVGGAKGVWADALPITGQSLAMASLLAGEAPSALQVWGSATLTLALTVGCLALLLRLFRSERIVFGR